MLYRCDVCLEEIDGVYALSRHSCNPALLRNNASELSRLRAKEKAETEAETVFEGIKRKGAEEDAEEIPGEAEKPNAPPPPPSSAEVEYLRTRDRELTMIESMVLGRYNVPGTVTAVSKLIGEVTRLRKTVLWAAARPELTGRDYREGQTLAEELLRLAMVGE